MFSKNRYGKRAMLNLAMYRVSNEIYDGFYWKEYKLRTDSSTGLIHKYDPIDAEKYYSDDKFYSEHVVGNEWFAKERQEYLSGFWNPYFDFLISRMNPKLPLLDVGCGAGWFMDYYMMQKVINKAYGIEPSKLAIINAPLVTRHSISRNHEDFCLLSEHDRELYDSFNILMSLTLEHIPDPVEFIQQYLQYIGDNGTLTIVVPNDFSPLQRWIGSTHFIQDVHVNYFTPDSLEKVICEALPESNPPIKYKLTMSVTFPMELFEVLGIHYIGNPSIGAKCHRFRLIFEKFLQKRAFWLYEKLFKKYGWGRELIYTVKQI